MCVVWRGGANDAPTYCDCGLMSTTCLRLRARIWCWVGFWTVLGFMLLTMVVVQMFQSRFVAFGGSRQLTAQDNSTNEDADVIKIYVELQNATE